MKALKLTTADRQQIKAFRGIIGKRTLNVEEVNKWAQGVTNPAICKADSIVVTAKGELSIRSLSEVLRPVYREERTKVLAVKKVTRRGRKAKDTDVVDSQILELASALSKLINRKK